MKTIRSLQFLSRNNFSSFQENMKKYGQNSILKSRENTKYHQEYLGTADSIIKRRREQAKFLELQNEEKKAMQAFVTAYTDTVIEFNLYFHHYDAKSQELDAILNYYQISYKRNTNALFINDLKAKFPKLKEKGDPILKVNVSLDTPNYVCGNNEIIKFMQENSFIIIAKHLTNSVYAKQGVEFVEKVNENLDKMFYHPVLTFENHFKSDPESYNKLGRNYIFITGTRKLFTHCFKLAFQNILNIYKDTESYQNSRKQLLDHLDEWGGRMGDNDFHGGDNPDEADFAMYGVFQAKYQSRSFRNFVDNKIEAKVRRWFYRMAQNCKYDPDRIMYNE